MEQLNQTTPENCDDATLILTLRNGQIGLQQSGNISLLLYCLREMLEAA